MPIVLMHLCSFDLSGGSLSHALRATTSTRARGPYWLHLPSHASSHDPYDPQRPLRPLGPLSVHPVSPPTILPHISHMRPPPDSLRLTHLPTPGP
ncbi:hypothetical protein JB92DRAFT_1353761 [Gautieria morchelliformis]|nr:hypothetical protein JB92DRAFT_1353761 [Gautieria morchelliformis]